MNTNKSFSIRKLILKLFPAAAISGGIPAINAFVINLTVGRYMGESGLAIIGLFNPLTLCISAVTLALVTGTSLLCGKYLGKGDTDGLSDVYSTTMAMCAAFGSVIAAAFILFPNTLARFVGSTAEVLSDVSAYIQSYSIGVIFIMLFSCLIVFLQFYGMGNCSVILGCGMVLLNLIGIILNFEVFHGGIFGVGIVNSAANVIMTAVLLLIIKTKGKLFKFSLSNIKFSIFKKSAQVGFPAAVEPLFQFIRNLVINAFALSIYGIKGVSALAIASSISTTIGTVICKGYIGTTSMVSSILVSERDVKSLRELHKNAASIVAPLFITAYIFIFIFANKIALLFGVEPDNIDLSRMAIRVLTLWFITNIFKETNVSIANSVNRTGLTITGAFFDALFVPVACCFLAKLVGFWLIPLSNALGEIACIATYLIYFRIKNKRLPKSVFRISDVPNSLSVPKEDRFDLTIKSQEDAISASESVVNFCKAKGISNRTAYHCGLCIEEIAMFTLQKNFKKYNEIELRIIYENGGLSILFRDNCEKFDPISWLKVCSPEDKLKSLGIKMISGISSEMKYISALGLNILTISLKDLS